MAEEEVASVTETVVEATPPAPAEEAAVPIVEEILAVLAPVVEEAIEEVAAAVVPVAEEVAAAAEEVAAVAEGVAKVAEGVAAVAEEVAAVAKEAAAAAPAVVDEVPAATAVPEPCLGGDISGSVTPSLLSVLGTEDDVPSAAAVSSPPSILLLEEVKKMSAPQYTDLGKEARDLFTKDFPLGTINLTATTKSTEGFDFALEGFHHTHSANTVAALCTKYTWAPQGVSVAHKWDTDNLISSNISVQSKLLDGLTLDLDTTLSPLTGKKTALAKASYQHGDNVHATADVDFGDLSAPTLHGRAVAAYKGWHAGYHVSYDTANKSLVNNNFRLAYKTDDVVLNGLVLNGTNYVGSLHHQVNEKLSAAVLIKYASERSETSFTLGGSYSVDDTAVLKAKVDNNLGLGLSYVQKLWGGLEVTLAGLVNGKDLDKGGHKFGVSLNFDA